MQDGKPVGSMSTEMTRKRTGTKVSVVERDSQGTVIYNGSINVRPESGLTYRAEHTGETAGGGVDNNTLQKIGKTLRESKSRENEQSRSSGQRQEGLKDAVVSAVRDLMSADMAGSMHASTKDYKEKIKSDDEPATRTAMVKNINTQGHTPT
jgi:hypothetical protein